MWLAMTAATMATAALVAKIVAQNCLEQIDRYAKDVLDEMKDALDRLKDAASGR